MKFSAIFAFAFIAAVNAGGNQVSVTFTKSSECESDALVPPTYTDCGLNTLPSSQLNYREYAYIVGNEYGVTFYEDRLCEPEGGRSQKVEGDQCYNVCVLDWDPQCLYIECA